MNDSGRRIHFIVDLQVNDISTAGPLHLKEKYGALQISACDDQECLKTAALSYFVPNDGDAQMTVESVTREIPGEPSADSVSILLSNPILSP